MGMISSYLDNIDPYFVKNTFYIYNSLFLFRKAQYNIKGVMNKL